MGPSRLMGYLVAVLALAISPSAAILAQSPATSYTIYGVVRLPSGEPAARVIVRVTSQSGLEHQDFADNMGRYEIRDLPRGRYQVSAVNPSDSSQYSDSADADTSRSFASRMLIHLYLRNRSASRTEKAAAPVISVGEAAQRVPKPALKAYEHAIKLRNERKHQEALTNLDKAIALYPGYFQALAERGHVKIGLGQSPDAASDFAAALLLNPQYEPALRGSGICKLEQGKFAEAVTDLESAAVFNPTVSSTYLFLGVANVGLDRREAARTALQKALSLDPNAAVRAHVHLASLYIKENRLQEAVAELQVYLAAAPNAPDAERLRTVESQLRARLNKN
jgi:tetratricopeptide (TPR) repeat protein